MKQSIKAAAVAAFIAYPTADEVWVSPDEQAFLHEQRAKMHNKDSVQVKRTDVLEDLPADESTDEPADESKAAAVKPEGADVVIARVKTCDSKEELEALKVSDSRKTVQAAIEKRLGELTAADTNQNPA